MDEEYMVDNDQTAMDDSISEEGFDSEFLEEAEEAEESLDSVTGGEETEEEQKPEKQGTSEPGYVQKRIDRALARERDNIKAEVMAEMEAQYAPIKERLLEMDAQELVRKGTVKDLETAKELLRYRQGQAPQQAQPKAEQPRQPNGQYAPKEDPVIKTEIKMLKSQADKIKAKTGIDVIEIFSNNEDIKNKVISGEMDFYDVAEQAKESRRKPPAPARSSNGASGQSPNAIDSMSKEQFARLEKKISEGARISLR